MCNFNAIPRSATEPVRLILFGRQPTVEEEGNLGYYEVVNIQYPSVEVALRLRKESFSYALWGRIESLSGVVLYRIDEDRVLHMLELLEAGKD